MFTTGLRKFGAAILCLVLALGVSACGNSSEGEKGGKGDTITLGFVPSWTDGRSTAYLLEKKFKEMGYQVKMQDLPDAGTIYVGLAQGDIDIFASAWPEVTQKAYMDKYEAKIESLGHYYDNAKLTWAVPEYSQINSIEDLPKFADVLGKRIIGIEPGAGLTGASENSVIPKYELNDWELVTSSTTAMLAELKKATSQNKEIVVTLWRPFWANSTFKTRDLEDPKGALGEPESLHFLATKGFGEKYPDIAEWIGKIKMSDDEYGSLEDTVVNKFGEGKEREAIDAWIEENKDNIEFLKSDK